MHSSAFPYRNEIGRVTNFFQHQRALMAGGLKVRQVFEVYLVLLFLLLFFNLPTRQPS
jgi:hypothetical protein